MSLSFIRNYYRVPAESGMQVTCLNTAKQLTGSIAGALGAKLVIKTSEGWQGLFHPVLDVQYPDSGIPKPSSY